MAREPKAVVKSVKDLVPDRAAAIKMLVRLLSQFLTRSEIEALVAETQGDALLFLVSAVALALSKHPLGSAYLEKALKAAAGERIRRYLDGLPSKEALKPVLYGVLYASLRRQFEIERAHHVPRVSFDQAVEFLGQVPLPGPGSLPAKAWALLDKRTSLGLTQEEMAEVLGLSRRVYCDMERGRKEVPAEVLERLSALEANRRNSLGGGRP